MSGLAAWGAAIGGFLLVVGIVAAAVVVVRSTLPKATIETLKESNSALVDQNKILEHQLELLKAELAAERDHSATQDRQLADLRELLSGRAELAKLNERLDTLAVQLDESHSALMGAVLRGKESL